MYDSTSATAPLARSTKAAAAILSSRSAPFLAMVYWAFAAFSVAMAALRCAVTSSSFCAGMTPWSNRFLTRLYDFSAISTPAIAFCHIS